MIKRFKIPKILILAGYFVLILIHFLIKDYFYFTGIVFYAFPLLGIIGIGILLVILFINNEKIFEFLTLLLFLLSIYWWYHSFHFEPKVIETDNKQTVLFWNIAKQKDRPLNIISKHVDTDSPEFIGLVEADYISDSIFEIYKDKLQNYNLIQLEGDMIFGSKAPITNVFYVGVNDDYAINHISVSNGNGAFEILMIDLYGSPLHNKKPPFEIIYNYLNNHPIDFILGDFNTPYESVYFRKLESDFESFHGLNTGLTYTWPKGLPLYELDQIWISKKHEALKLQKLNYTISDHSLLIGHFNMTNNKQN